MNYLEKIINGIKVDLGLPFKPYPTKLKSVERKSYRTLIQVELDDGEHADFELMNIHNTYWLYAENYPAKNLMFGLDNPEFVTKYFPVLALFSIFISDWITVFLFMLNLVFLLLIVGSRLLQKRSNKLPKQYQLLYDTVVKTNNNQLTKEELDSFHEQLFTY